MEIMKQMMTDSFSLPLNVQAWMMFMMIVFFSQLYFFRHTQAKVAFFGFFIVAMILAPILYSQTHELHHFVFIHLIAWPPIIYYLSRELFFKKTVKIRSPLGVSLLVANAVYITSLVLDVRIAVSMA